VAQAKAVDQESAQSGSNVNNPLRPSVRWQVISVLREAYFFNGYIERNTLKGHSDTVTGVSFSPNGETLASASLDGTVKLWNLQGEELQTLEGHSKGVTGVSFSPDGETLASASADSTVILWNLNLDDLMAKSCDRLRDYMANPTTPPEKEALCEGYLPPALLQSAAPGPLDWVANVRAFLGTALARP
jgi:WD40 repeat protein